jgi:hypothetical protein
MRRIWSSKKRVTIVVPGDFDGGDHKVELLVSANGLPYLSSSCDERGIGTPLEWEDLEAIARWIERVKPDAPRAAQDKVK